MKRKHDKISRVGSLIKVRPEYQERYIILHKHTFPGVLNRLYLSNIRNYSIFLRDGILFSYLEYIGNDYQSDMQNIGNDETTRDWWKLTDPMQEALENRNEGEWWATMDLILHVDAHKADYKDVQRFAYHARVRVDKMGDLKKWIDDQGDLLSKTCNEQNIQNVTLYAKGADLYAYFEYSGSDLVSEFESFRDKQKLQKAIGEFQSFFKQTKNNAIWEPMELVFHTD